MPKYYVLPIDENGLGYFGIKEAYNPYNHTPWFCGGCPQLFGGNDQGGIPTTLHNETLEESHWKIHLGQGSRFYKKVHQLHDMHFFVCTKFVYYPDKEVPLSIRQSFKQYWETTGEVLKVDMDGVPTTNRADAATRVLQSYVTRTGRRPRMERVGEFLISETAEAIRKAAEVVQNGGLPALV